MNRKTTASSSGTLGELLEQDEIAHRVLLQHAPKLRNEGLVEISTQVALSGSPLSHDGGPARAF
jgi:hypothetical protein